MNPLIQLKKVTPLLLVAVVLGSFTLLPKAQAVLPAPDGGYPGQNTAEGEDALFSLTTGKENTALGFKALFRTTTGNFNTANGSLALFENTTGTENTATGVRALFSNTMGTDNTATGVAALIFNTIGTNNTATGRSALASNTSGSINTANGSFALALNTTGNRNTADGVNALLSNETGSNNIALGATALVSNSTGSNNIALGAGAGGLLTTGDNNIDIGNEGVDAEANTIRIGTQGTQTATYIAGIYQTTVRGLTVVVDSTGHLGTKGSSARFKDAIKPIDKASEAIHALKPVTFRYKQEIDPEGVPQFGLVAEDVEKVNPDLVARDDKGRVYTVRYEAVNAMLLNEFLKEHRTVQELKATAAKQEATIAKQQKQIEALTTGLQKVSAGLEMSKPASHMIGNNQ